MTAQLIDGKKNAQQLLAKLALQTKEFFENYQRKPNLVVILVGEDPASQVYVRNKEKTALLHGYDSKIIQMASSTSQQQLLENINELNNDEAVDGILVQLPLPQHIDSNTIIQAINPAKDVDGFHPINTGLLYQNNPGLVPCTPLGCIHLLKSVHTKLDGMSALVIGRSNIVGRPLAALLLAENCTVTIAHSRTTDIQKIAAQSQLVIAAAGQPRFITKDWIAEGATVIDVGIHRIEDSTHPKGSRLVGDVHPSVAEVAGYLTPVPGGVGPMTIAYLLSNTLKAARDRMCR